MSFQWLIDNAESISIDSRPVVATSQSRGGVIRSVSRGGAVWQFSVRLPDGPRWSQIRSDIAGIEALGRTTSAPIKFSGSGQEWITPYMGSAVTPANLRATVPVTGNTITLTSGQAVSGYNFRAGDIIQLGTVGAVYRVTADVPAGTNTVSLHRPLQQPAATNVAVLTGSAVTWQVRCVQQPLWTLFARDQVSWSGDFVLIEDYL